MNLNKIILSLLVASLFITGCFPTFYGRRPVPIDDPKKPIEFGGFTILPPQGKGWMIAQKTNYFAVLGKNPLMTKKGPHTFGALVKTYTLDRDIRDKNDYLNYIKKQLLKGKKDESRFTLKKSEAKLHEINGAVCVRYHLIFEDRGVPGYVGNVFIMDGSGIACRNPYNPVMVTQIDCSQRYPKEIKPISLEQEVEPYLNSLTFKPLPKPVIKAMLPLESNVLGIAAGFGSIWVVQSSKNSIARIDPYTLRVIQTIYVGRHPVYIIKAGSNIWVAKAKDGYVSIIDPRENSVMEAVKVGDIPQYIVSGFGSVWVANRNSRTVSRINIKTKKIEATINVGVRPVGLASGKDSVWVTSFDDNVLVRINPSNNTISGEPVYVGKNPLGIAADTEDVWVVVQGENSIVRINQKSSTIVSTIKVGTDPSSIVIAEDMVWVANMMDDTLVKIDPNTNSVTGSPIPVGRNPFYIHFFKKSLFVSNWDEGSLYRLDFED